MKSGIISPPPKSRTTSTNKKRAANGKQKATFVDDIGDGIGDTGSNEVVGTIYLG